jgi:hypothetical protein
MDVVPILEDINGPVTPLMVSIMLIAFYKSIVEAARRIGANFRRLFYE